jgi:hypothetical protein
MSLRKYTSEQLTEAARLYVDDGLTSVEVAQVTGVSAARVNQLVRKLGLSRPKGFQQGNLIFAGRTHTDETKAKIRAHHLATGHKPSLEARVKGQPRSLKAQWGNHQRDPVQLLLYTYTSAASKRGLCFELTREQFEKLVTQPCFYCEHAPSPRKVRRAVVFACNGVDRVDNTLGYVMSNCVSACSTCNRMKFQHSAVDFIRLCKVVATHWEGRSP